MFLNNKTYMLHSNMQHICFIILKHSKQLHSKYVSYKLSFLSAAIIISVFHILKVFRKHKD